MQRKGTVAHCWWKCKPMQSVLKRVLRFLKKKMKQNKKLACDPPITLLEKIKTPIQK